MSVYVRRLRPNDLVAVLAIAKWLHENSRYSIYSYNEAKVERLLSMSVTNPNKVYVSVALEKGSGVILGYFHGFTDTHYFSDEKYAADFALCILPQHRRKAPEILTKMIHAFEKWAKSQGATEVSIGASTEAHGTGYKKFLTRMGYRDIGFLAVKG